VKDDDARCDIRILEAEVGDARKRHDKLVDRLQEHEDELRDRFKVLERTGLTVKNCPKCKHPVLAQAVWAQTPKLPRIGDIHQCLTCGCKFTYKKIEQLVEDEAYHA